MKRALLCIVHVGLATIFLESGVLGRSSKIQLSKNGYTGLVIGIHRNIPENSTLIDAIKEKFTKASKQLYKSTNKRAYFKEITILLPKSWPDKPEYGQVTGELYEKADVIVASPNPRHRNNPYVKTYSGCGDPGVHMHLTPEYLTDPKSEQSYGPAGKLIVHEWAHFRWGVFDEYPTDGVQEFYFSPSTGRLEATRCTAAMKGRIWEYVDKGGGRTGIRFCRVDPILGTYRKNCHFYPHDTKRWQRGLKGSIMDRQYIEGVEHFCENNKADPKIHHNSEAPNKHNRLCRGRSTWEVIEDSLDFKNRNNLPRDIPEADLVPKFNMVRTRDRRVVLVMDTSGSMTSDAKLTRMNQAASQYIQDGIDEDSELGIVEFSTSARMASPMRVIRSHIDRDILTNDLKKKASGGTSIGAGLEKAVEMLKAGGGKVDGALILLITDGGENGTPRVMDVIPQLYSSRVTVDTLAYTHGADESLAAMSHKTGGKFYYDSNDPQTNALNDAFFDMSTQDKDEDSRPVQIRSKAFEMTKDEAVTTQIAIDDTLGKDTLFVFTYTHDVPITVMLTSPSGVQFDETSPEYNVTNLKVIRFRFPNGEVGTWRINITNPAPKKQRTSYTVSSKPRDKNDLPITVKADMSAVKTDVMRVAVFAEAAKGPYPVTGMTVIATVDRLFSTPYQLELLDNGLGADVTKGDGIYSRYFTAFTANGRYSVSVEINNEKGVAAVQEGKMVGEEASFRVSMDDPLRTIPPKIQTKITKVNSTVSRSTTAGAFEFKRKGTSAPLQPLADLLAGKDDVAPGTITDLIVSRTSHKNGTVSLTWMATGDDEDVGTATRYEICMGETYKDLAENPQHSMNITQDMLTAGNLSSPKPSGEREHFTVKVDVTPAENASFVFTVRAIDDVGLEGEYSNIATAGLGYVPDVLILEVVEPEIYADYIEKVRSTSLPQTQPTTPNTLNIITLEVKEQYSTKAPSMTAQPETKSTTTHASTPQSKVKRSPFSNPVVLGAMIGGCSFVVLTITIALTALYCVREKVKGRVGQTPERWVEKTQDVSHGGPETHGRRVSHGRRASHGRQHRQSQIDMTPIEMT